MVGTLIKAMKHEQSMKNLVWILCLGLALLCAVLALILVSVCLYEIQRFKKSATESRAVSFATSGSSRSRDAADLRGEAAKSVEDNLEQTEVDDEDDDTEEDNEDSDYTMPFLNSPHNTESKDVGVKSGYMRHRKLRIKRSLPDVVADTLNTTAASKSDWKTSFQECAKLCNCRPKPAKGVLCTRSVKRCTKCMWKLTKRWMRRGKRSTRSNIHVVANPLEYFKHTRNGENVFEKENVFPFNDGDRIDDQDIMTIHQGGYLINHGFNISTRDSRGKGLELRRNKIVVTKAGLYLLYAQATLRYNHTKIHSGFVLHVGDNNNERAPGRAVARCLSTNSMKDESSPHCMLSCNIMVALRLRANSFIRLHCHDKCPSLIMKPTATYFGVAQL